jgi:hypothetical protein
MIDSSSFPLGNGGLHRIYRTITVISSTQLEVQLVYIIATSNSGEAILIIHVTVLDLEKR